MARIARVVMPGVAHHVTQRGNRRMQTFFGDDDYRAYLSLLGEWSRTHGVGVWAYRLMPSHVHLILVPPAEEALCRCVGETQRRYSRRLNFRESWRGYLWQSRFASYPMDDAYTLTAAAYAERNPVKAALVGEAVGRALPAAGARQDRWRAQPALLAAWKAQRTAA